MGAWRHLLGGLLLWAGHFFAVYGIASVLPGDRAATILVLIVTAVAMIAAASLFIRAMRALRTHGDKLQHWMQGLSAYSYALAAVAIAYQALPAAL